MKILFVILSLIILYLIILIISQKININKKNDSSHEGICVFDIDGTSLEGQYNTCYYKGKKYDQYNGGCTAAAIQACKDKNYDIGVNTASFRNRNFFCKKVGMADENGKCLVDEKNWWNNQKYYLLGSGHGSNHGGCGKAYVMKKICDINGIKNRKKAVLWDDLYKNITGAESAGFGVIPMPNLNNCITEIGTRNNHFYKGIQQKQVDDFVKGNINYKECDNFGKTVCDL